MIQRFNTSLEARLAGIVGLGLVLFSLIAGGVTFVIGYRAQIDGARDLQDQLVRTVKESATVAAFAGTDLPPGWLFAEGQELSLNDEYSGLFQIIGTIYGGDGQSTFALPDLRGRVPVGVGYGPGATYWSGEASGSNLTTLTAQNVLTGSPISNLQPTLALTFEMALSGAYPSGNSACLCLPWDLQVLGEINMYAYGESPTFGPDAAGQLLVLNQNQALFSLLGTRFGGNGFTNFALPDLRGRVVVGAGASAIDPSRSLLSAQRFGTESVMMEPGVPPVTSAFALRSMELPPMVALPLATFIAELSLSRSDKPRFWKVFSKPVKIRWFRGVFDSCIDRLTR
jgi:microcystin-dependent protein